MNATAEKSRMLLPETLDLAAAESFHEMMRERMNGGGSFRMDASAVKTLTLPGVQIILSAIRGGDGITIADPSSAFTSAFEDLGLDWIQYLDRSETPEQVEEAEISGEIVSGTESAAADTGTTQGSSAPADHNQISESPMSKRILTIDDSKTMRDMLMLTLAEAGFDVLQAVDGQDGLDVLVDQQVDVVITDINMPRMDGYEVIRQLRKNPDHKTTPILVLTTESEAEKKNLAREAGATGWMVKPFDPDRLVATVRKVAP